MAEPLPVLIKLAEQKVLKAQKDIAATNTSITNLENRRNELHRQLTDGGNLANASNNIAMLQQAGAFVGRVKREETHLNELRTILDAQLANQKAELAKHYAEQKRYETLWKQEQAKRARIRAAKQQALLDEAGGVGDWLNRKEQNQ